MTMRMENGGKRLKNLSGQQEPTEKGYGAEGWFSGHRLSFYLPAAAGIFLTSFLLAGAVLSFRWGRGEEQTAKPPAAERVVLSGDRVEERIYYTQCQHLLSQGVASQTYLGLNSGELGAQGWQATAKEDGSWWLYREAAALCPADGGKRSVRRNGEKISVYAGGLGMDGTVLFDLDYGEAALPESWQQQLARGGIEYNDEQTLFSALESLDEYLE